MEVHDTGPTILSRTCSSRRCTCSFEVTPGALWRTLSTSPTSTLTRLRHASAAMADARGDKEHRIRAHCGQSTERSLL